eukprot:362355-Chlamydomonas_euryale.AAC.9
MKSRTTSCLPLPKLTPISTSFHPNACKKHAHAWLHAFLPACIPACMVEHNACMHARPAGCGPQVKAFSVKRIVSPLIFDNLKNAVLEGLYDPALGPIDLRGWCARQRR